MCGWVGGWVGGSEVMAVESWDILGKQEGNVLTRPTVCVRVRIAVSLGAAMPLYNSPSGVKPLSFALQLTSQYGDMPAHNHASWCRCMGCSPGNAGSGLTSHEAIATTLMMPNVSQGMTESGQAPHGATTLSAQP